MSTLSSDFEDPRRLKPDEIAFVQLNEAIALLIAQKFLPAATLAGAAQENAKSRGLSVEMMQEFENWIIRNVAT